MIRKVLVANRGEIAVRIIRACKELGLVSVAVFSEVDRTALHVRLADEAYFIGPAPATQSYLSIPKIIDVAIRAGADAVHPGYGFLAENPRFAQACAEAGITFVGPDYETIRLLGDKVRARRFMRRAGLPIVPAATKIPGKILPKPPRGSVTRSSSRRQPVVAARACALCAAGRSWTQLWSWQKEKLQRLLATIPFISRGSWREHATLSFRSLGTIMATSFTLVTGSAPFSDVTRSW